MKLSKQIKEDLAKAYRCAMEISILDMKAPLRYINQYIAENVSGYGTAADEKVKSRVDYRKMLMKSRQQAKGMLFKAKIITPYRPKFIDATTAQFHDEIVVQIGDKKNKHSINLYMSCVYKYQFNKWQLVLFHGSMPDPASTIEDTFHLGEAEKKLKALEQVVAQRTADLQTKTRELEIEASLERVRAVAMSMSKPDDLLNICKQLYRELQSLGFDELRNTMIHRFFDEKEYFINYDFSDATGGVISPIQFKGNRLMEKFVKDIRKKNDSFSELQITGKELKEWKAFRKRNKEYEDPRLNNIKALYYYNYSVSESGIGISTYGAINSEKLAVLKRFRNIFELAYKRYIDITNAEAQAREVQIELALERVRSRSMAMHNTSELQEVIHTVHKELLNLGIAIHGGSFISINSDIDNNLRCWGSGGTADTSAEVHIPLYEKQFCTNLIKRIKKGPGFFTEEYSQQEKKEFFTFLFKHEPWSKLDTKQKKETLSSPGGYTRSCCVSQHTSIFIINHFGEKFSVADNDILQRFGKVFEQTYTRFLDLQKAEAQAKEAQIEASLERLRSKTMAMHKSSELNEAAELLYKELTKLGIEKLTCGYTLLNDKTTTGICYMANPEGSFVWEPFHLDHSGSPGFLSIYENWKKQEPFLSFELSGKANVEHNRYLAENAENFPIPLEQLLAILPPVTHSNSFNFRYGYLLVVSLSSFTKEQVEIGKRFTKVFEQTYTRFLDLQKAEAQAREAKIEAALERVRSRTMAMYKSEELAEAATLVFKQFNSLGLLPVGSRVFFSLIDEGTVTSEVWTTKEDGVLRPGNHRISLKANKHLKDVYKSWKGRKSIYNSELTGSVLTDYLKYIASVPNLKEDKTIQQIVISPPDRLVFTEAFFKQGTIGVVGIIPLSQESQDTLMRFSKVFEQTYTRFLDLQKAEAQAREAEIELALERVRARTMAMQSSDELREAVLIINEQLKQLSFDSKATNIIIIDKDSSDSQYWVSGFTKDIYPVSYHVPHLDHPYYDALLQPWKQGKQYVVYEYTGEGKKSFDKIFFTKTDFKHVPEEAKNAMMSLPSVTLSTAFFTNGALQVIGPEPVSAEKVIILKRFAKVFNQTYTRFLDLQKAEEQTREAQIELGLERVRARAMAMQTSDELKELIGTVFTELTKLDLVLTRCVIMIYNGQEISSRWWMANSEDPNNPAGFFIKRHEHSPMVAYFKAWHERKLKYTYALQGKIKKDWDEFLFSETELKNLPDFVIEGMKSPDLVYLNASFNNFGNLTLASLVPLSDEHFDILLRFAKVFDLTYTRFNDLQKAEAQARESQIQLALERVRARTMAMQHSDELQDAAILLFQQMKALSVQTGSCGFNIWSKDEKAATVWMSSAEGGLQTPFTLPHTESAIYKQVYDAMKEGVDFLVKEVGGKNLKKHFDYLLTLPGIGNVIKELRDTGYSFPETMVYHFAFFSQGYLSFHLHEQHTETHDIFKRFAKVFEQTYTRFLDLQKAEAQAREAQIEAALERTRTQSMIMQHSKELDDTLLVFHEQVLLLGINSAFSFLWLPDEKNDQHIFWAAWKENGNDSTGFKSKAINYPLNRNEPATAQCLIDWKSNEPVYSYHVPPAAVENYFAVWQELIDGVDHLKPEHFSIGLHYVEAFMKYGCFGVMVETDLNEDEKKLLNRFAIEFERTYTRFLDLQKAEAQAREAQIELSLERIRARVTAMKVSSDLLDIVVTMRTEFVALGHEAHYFWHMRWLPDMYEKAMTSGDGSRIGHVMTLPRHIHGDVPLIATWEKTNEPTVVYAMDAEAAVDYVTKMINLGNFEQVDPNSPTLDDIRHIGGLTFIMARTTHGEIGYSLPGSVPQPPADGIATLIRFAAVFDLAYRRFEDLKSSEKQIREAQIELALERVRARSLAMHKSEELADLSLELVKQVQALGVATWFCAFNIYDDNPQSSIEWGSNGVGTFPKYRTPREHVFLKYYEAGQKGETFIINTIGEDECPAHYEYLCTLPGIGDQLLAMKAAGIPFPSFQIDHVAFMKYGYVLFITYDPVPEAHDIFIRFAKVFEQTYTRFLDLQKAEEQTKEAQIEAALEKVRSRTMAMQSSNELQETAAVLFNEFKKLGTDDIYQVTIGIYNEEERLIDFRSTSWADDGAQESRSFSLSMEEPTVIKPAVIAWKANKKSLVIDLSGEALEGWLNYRNKISGITKMSTDTGGRRVITAAYYSKGHLSISTPVPVPAETIRILERFASVFDATYTRFLDLQKAEAQARESQIEAALERVRSRTMSMQKSDELAETAAEVFRQLILLGIEPNRLYIGIVKEETGDMEMWATDEDGTQVGKKFTFNKNENASVLKLYDGWKAQKKSVIVDMQGKELEEYFHYLNHVMHIPFKGGLTQKRRVQSVAYFSKGFIGMASPDGQGEDSIQLLERFAAVFNLTFTRFNDLKIAEAHAAQAEQDLIAIKEAKQKAEEALSELQATQKQLIQSEKMASLGELTAGIAHEIQNPLNFVNNFSEVSKELLDEMKEAIEKGDTEEAKEIMNDVIQNLEKINHHGKRADGIVKGMLQHSRSSNNQKEATDINVLADEYLRLAYHGLRAKDKSFNATLKTNYDETIGKINIIPQDMGRVILNLITNAFYVVAEKKKESIEGYEPTVSVSTKKMGDKMEVSVKDNGNGIPPKILDKIFQPFFTTKPTGQGTGLGLSLSYDIVKAHGGEIKVNTNENEGTEFIIQLPV